MATNLTALIDTFVQQSASASRALRDLRDVNQNQFFEEALRSLREQPNSPGSVHLLRMIMGDPRLLERLADPAFLAVAAATDLARRLQAMDPTLDVKLLRLLLSKEAWMHDSWRTTRVLEIVGAVSDGKRIQPLLASFVRHSDVRVRSKAALLVGRVNRNTRWLEQYMAEPDPRIRANAVEALWGTSSPEARALFIKASEDANHRVAGNGIVGLHRAGDLLSAAIAEKMTTHEDPWFRAATVWAMGETSDPRFLPALATLTKDSNDGVRRNALRATIKIRKRLEQLRKREPLRLSVTASDGKFEVRVKSSSGLTVPILTPTDFAVLDQGRSLEIICAQAKTQENGSVYYELTFAAAPSEGARVCVYTSTGMGEEPLHSACQAGPTPA